MKKWLALLLFFITLAGTAFPCCTEDDCTNEQPQKERHAHNSREEKGPCSPFFACGTCAPSVLLTDPNLTVLAIPQSAVAYSTYYLVRLRSFASSPFQPPRHLALL